LDIIKLIPSFLKEKFIDCQLGMDETRRMWQVLEFRKEYKPFPESRELA
jgi:hypothetical protein